MTAEQLIGDALRSIGAIASGEPIKAAEAQDALTALNQMIDSWGIHRLTLLVTTRSTYTLTPGTQVYTIGPSAVAPNFHQNRPPYLSDVGLIAASTPDLEVLLEPMNEDQWAVEGSKTLTGQPTRYYFKKDTPEASLTFWPIPTAADTAVLYWPTPTSQFLDLTTDHLLANGYEEALRYNLAVRLCPEFGRPVDPVVAALAGECLGNIKRANKTELLMAVDEALLNTSGTFDIRTGDYHARH